MGDTGGQRGSYDTNTVDGFGFEWSVYDQEDRTCGALVVDPVVPAQLVEAIT